MDISSELKKRIITAAVGVVVLVLVILVGKGWGVFLFASALSLAMMYEFGGVFFSLSDQQEKRYVLLILTWLLVMMNALIPHADYALLGFTFLGIFSYFLVTATRHPDFELGKHFYECAGSVFGVVYLVFLPFFFQRIYELSQGVKWFFLFLLIVWASDIVAYFVGKRYGRVKLYPSISPNKTVEGAIAGVVGSVLIAALFKLIFFRGELSWGAMTTIASIVCMVSQVGDLCESFFKRAFAKKDTSSILPGHGGVLDRFDGVIFSLPAMYACVRLLT